MLKASGGVAREAFLRWFVCVNAQGAVEIVGLCSGGCIRCGGVLDEVTALYKARTQKDLLFGPEPTSVAPAV